MPVILLSRIKVRPGCEARFEAAIRTLYAAMAASEPGCLQNVMHRSLGGPPGAGAFAAAAAGDYVFYEVYASQAGGQAHPQTPHFAAFMAEVQDLIDGPILLEFLDELVAL